MVRHWLYYISSGSDSKRTELKNNVNKSNSKSLEKVPIILFGLKLLAYYMLA